MQFRNLRDSKMSDKSTCFSEEFNMNQESIVETSSCVVVDPEHKTESSIVIEEVADIDDTAYIYFHNDSDSGCNDLLDSRAQEESGGDSKTDQDDDQQEDKVCTVCNKTYKNKGSLATHLRAKHNMSIGHRAKMPCLESGCDFRGNRIARLITHLIRAHKKKFQCEKVTFKQKEGKADWLMLFACFQKDQCKTNFSYNI